MATLSTTNNGACQTAVTVTHRLAAHACGHAAAPCCRAKRQRIKTRALTLLHTWLQGHAPTGTKATGLAATRPAPYTGNGRCRLWVWNRFSVSVIDCSEGRLVTCDAVICFQVTVCHMSHVHCVHMSQSHVTACLPAACTPTPTVIAAAERCGCCRMIVLIAGGAAAAGGLRGGNV